MLEDHFAWLSQRLGVKGTYLKLKILFEKSTEADMASSCFKRVDNKFVEQTGCMRRPWTVPLLFAYNIMRGFSLL